MTAPARNTKKSAPRAAAGKATKRKETPAAPKRMTHAEVKAFLEENHLTVDLITGAHGETIARQRTQKLDDPHSFGNRTGWVHLAKCRDIDPDALFVTGSAQRQAAAICRHCPVILQCRADALDNRVDYGVWGGMTERQRRALLRAHPEVTSWADFYAGKVNEVSGFEEDLD